MLLIVALAIPVTAGSALLLADSATLPTPERVDAWRLGTADLRVSEDGGGGYRLPQGSRTSHILSGQTIIGGTDTPFSTTYISVDLSDSLTHGLFLLRKGRTPTATGEIGMSSSLLDRLGVEVGETITAGMPQRTFTVVGVLDETATLKRAILVTVPGSSLSRSPERTALVELPPSAAGWTPPLDVRFTGPARPDPGEQARRLAGVTLVTAFAGFQVVLLVGAAFALSSRRQQRELALVAAAGGSLRQVSRIVLGKGLLFGAAAGTLGIGLAFILFHLGYDALERLSDHPVSGGETPLVGLVAAWFTAVVLGGLAALGSARGISVGALLPALSRREVSGKRLARRLVWLGLPTVAIGALVVIYSVHPEVSNLTAAAVGAGLALCGLAALAPVLILAVGRLAIAAVLPVRLALRQASRRPLRTGAAAAAVCAATAGSVGIALFLAADTSTAASTNLRPGQVLLPEEATSFLTSSDVAQISATLPAHTSVRFKPVGDSIIGIVHAILESGGLPVDPPQQVAVGDETLIAAITGRDQERARRDSLRDGQIVVFYPQIFDDGTAHLEYSVGDEIRTVEMPAVLVPADDVYRELPAAVMTPETARQIGVELLAERVLFDVHRAPTNAELDQALGVLLKAQLQAQTAAPAAPVGLVVGRSTERSVTSNPMVYLLAMLSVMVTLLATGVAVALANAEMRDDMSTLMAVGGGPTVRGLIATCQAGLVVGVGVTLGVFAGFAPAAALLAMRPDLSWSLPWQWLLLTIVGAPILAMIGTALLIRPGVELRLRRIE